MKLHATRGQRVSYEDRSWLLWYVRGLLAFYLLFATWLTASSIRFGVLASSNPIAWFLPALGLMMMVGDLFVLFALLKAPLIFTTEALLIQHGFRRVRIAVQDIAGVGLVFNRPNPAWLGYRPPSGWSLMVWRSDGHGERTGVLYVPFSLRDSRPGREGKRVLANPARFDPVTGTDAGHLALTHAGQVARDIYGRVLSLQGPSGPLATKQLQKHLPAPSPWAATLTTAFWSPDGVLGYAGRQLSEPKAGMSNP